MEPNKGVVLQLFGRYVGTAREAGLRWANPFFSKHAVSLRTRNFQTEHIAACRDAFMVSLGYGVLWWVDSQAQRQQGAAAQRHRQGPGPSEGVRGVKIEDGGQRDRGRSGGFTAG